MRNVIDTANYTNWYGEKSKVLFYRKDKKGADTNLGYWNYAICFACFLGLHKKCLGSCTCQ